MKRYIKSATDNSADFEIDENGVLVKYHDNAANVVIPDGVTKIGSYAFRGCQNLTKISLPDGVTEIGWAAFQHCTRLTSITIPDSVTRIGWYAFSDCTGLTEVSLPDNVKLGKDVFKNTPLESKFEEGIDSSEALVEE